MNTLENKLNIRNIRSKINNEVHLTRTDITKYKSLVFSNKEKVSSAVSKYISHYKMNHYTTDEYVEHLTKYISTIYNKRAKYNKIDTNHPIGKDDTLEILTKVEKSL